MIKKFLFYIFKLLLINIMSSKMLECNYCGVSSHINKYTKCECHTFPICDKCLEASNNSKNDNYRHAIDEAITNWLLHNGISIDKINKIDYSHIDDELNRLLDDLEDDIVCSDCNTIVNLID
jgi:hypothetical protein